jgi:hypothetical protein
MKPAVTAIGGVVVGAIVTLGVAAFVLDDEGSGSGSVGRDDAVTGTAPTTSSTVDRDGAAVDRGGDVIVFLDRSVTESQQQSIEAWLDAQPEIASYEYWDQAESTAEARRLFRDNSEMLAKIDRGVWVPTSYRIRLASCDLVVLSRIVRDAEARPGVYSARSWAQSMAERCDESNGQPARAGRA